MLFLAYFRVNSMEFTIHVLQVSRIGGETLIDARNYETWLRRVIASIS